MSEIPYSNDFNISVENLKLVGIQQEKRNRARKVYGLTLTLVGISVCINIALFLYTVIRNGFSMENIYDINFYCLSILGFVAFSALFNLIIGFLGIYTNWKQLILVYTIMSILIFIGNLYMSCEIFAITKNTKLHLAQSWWDKYKEEDKIIIQEKYNCCGYLDMNDFPVISKNCPAEYVVYTIPQEILLKAKTKKNDSYKGHDIVYETKTNEINVSNIVSTNLNNGQAIKNTLEIMNSNISPPSNTQNKINNMDTQTLNKIIEDISMNNKRDINEKRQLQTNEFQAEGCEKHITSKVDSKIKILYIICYILSIPYFISIPTAIYYWWRLKLEVGYNEFQ